MMSISPPKSASQAVNYVAEEFSAGSQQYYSENDHLVGHWHGDLATRWGLAGPVDEAQFARLANGQHPITGEQMVKHQTPRKTAKGETTMEHRAGWDCTFSAPKSISLTALVGDVEEVREAHRVAVDQAFALAVQPHAQARLGGNLPAETTANLVVARFEHDSARPVKGYAAPQVHTHLFVMNVTQTTEGTVRPLQPHEIYKSKSYATAVYRTELDVQLRARGFQTVRGEHDQPEIIGYSTEYMEASSPRRKQIEDRLAELGLSGPKASEVAALDTRERKVTLTHEEVQRQHQAMAAQYGHQPARVVSERLVHAVIPIPGPTAEAAVLYARDRGMERDAVVDRRALLRDALVRSLGTLTVDQVHAEFAKRTKDGTFVAVEHRPGSASQAYTTPAMVQLERQNITRMQQGQTDGRPLAAAHLRRDIEDHYPHLSEHQRDAVTRILASTHQVQALDGVAGSGKTTTLAAVRDAAERDGFSVQGFAPTSGAAHLLREAGIPTTTLQRHLAKDGAFENAANRRLLVLDESSLASTPQVHKLLESLPASDRILLVGDTRQHEAVDAGTPYQQLIDHGIQTTRLEEIVRQRDPALRSVVEDLARGQVPHALAQLEEQGRIHEHPNRRDRYQAIAAEYLKQPNATLVVAPDNQSRSEINQTVHRAMQQAGHVQPQEFTTRTLVARNDLTGPDRQWAARYELGDILRYAKASKTIDVTAGTYARVTAVNPTDNRLSVRLDGRRTDLSYDPKRLHGVTVYREVDRAFAAGDRVQFTAPDKALGVANRARATIQSVHPAGGIDLTLDDGRQVTVTDTQHRHLDYGYAGTSHALQGATEDYVLFHADTGDRIAASLLNERTTYVALSRSRIGVEVFTDSKERLPQVLSREVNQQTAIEPAQTQARGHGFGR